MGIFLFAHGADAATLFVSPASVQTSVNQSVTVRISVDSGGGAGINAAEGKVQFDKNLLSVTSATKDGSIFNLWTAEPTFSNANGTVTFGGGSTNSYKGSAGAIITITFRAIAEGTAAISITEGSVLAADGKGTEALSKTIPGSVTITRAKAPPPPPPPPAPVAEPLGAALPPVAPKITSPTHPEEGKWYPIATVQLAWDLPDDASGVRVLLDTQGSSTPSEILKGLPKTQEFKDLPDGVWHFHIQSRNSAGWGTPAHRKILIDRTRPESVTVTVEQKSASDSAPMFALSAADKNSGVDRYDIAVDGGEPQQAFVKDLGDRPYQVSTLGIGSHVVIVRAVDKAGNVSDPAIKQFVVESGVELVEKKPGVLLQIWHLIAAGVLFILLAAALIVMTMIVKIQRMRTGRKNETIRKDALEANKRNADIFTALKQEIEEQITNINPDVNADQKRKTIDELQGALDVSEELLKKEIDQIETIGKE